MHRPRLPETAKRNGREADHATTDGDGSGPRALASRALRGVSRQVTRRIPRADLNERDPDYIRERLPLLWLFASLWYRGEVRGLSNIPESGPVLLVGTTPAETCSPTRSYSPSPSARTSASNGPSTSSLIISC